MNAPLTRWVIKPYHVRPASKPFRAENIAEGYPLYNTHRHALSNRRSCAAVWEDMLLPKTGAKTAGYGQSLMSDV